MIPVGMFKERNGDKYPPLAELIGKPMQHKAEIVRYLKRGQVRAAAPGIMRDFITGELTGRDMTMRTDGVYLWPSEAVYYVEKYDMALPEEFVGHILTASKIKS